MSFSNEQQLLVKLRDGDAVAFQHIYTIYAPRLTGKLMQLLRSEELAEDVLQDIFVKIWEIRTTIDLEQNFAAFLYKMAANRSKNVFRRNLYDELMRNQIGQDTGYNPIEDAMNESEATAYCSFWRDDLWLYDFSGHAGFIVGICVVSLITCFGAFYLYYSRKYGT